MVLSAGAAGGRRASELALALWCLLLPACRSLSLERGGLQREKETVHALARQQPSPPDASEQRLRGDLEQEDGLGEEGAAAKRWLDNLRKARAGSLETAARILNSSTGPPLAIAEVCAGFGLDEASCARVRTYLGGLRLDHQKKRVARVSLINRTIMVNHAVAIALRDFGCHGDIPGSGALVNKIYTDDMCRALDASASASRGVTGDLGERVIVFYMGDRGQDHNFCLPTITKTRGIPGDRGNSVLLDLNHHRHWGKVSQVMDHDSPLSAKREELVWRGGSTGGCDASSTGSRMMLVSKYFGAKDKRINIGMSEIVQDCHEAKKYLKNYLTMQQILERKYILVVDGNDKASGLNWALASNCVPFMIEPTIESWLLESSLKAWVHYVPVKPDFSDLSSQLDWAQANPDKVSEIAEAGVRHMRTFADPETEAKVEGAVLTTYFDRVEVVSGAHGVDADAQCS